jgi:hypothetical protein
MSLKSRLAVCLTIGAIVAGLVAGPASATNVCGPNDKGIWLIGSNDNGYGSWSEIQKVNDTLDQCQGGDADGQAVVAHTAGVVFDLSSSDFIEVGLYRSSIGGTIKNRVFGEAGFFPQSVGPFFYDNYSTGGTVDMKVTNNPGTFEWKLYWDVPNGGAETWVLLDAMQGISGQHGWAWGELARVGQTGTGGYDHHFDMQRKNSAGNWVDINSLVCWQMTDPDWKWHDISDTEF